jgi:hypothetical protein
VNAAIGDGRCGDAGPRRAGIRPGDRSCRRREGFEGQQAHGGESCFATGGNVVNPMIGSGTQQGREVAEEQTVEVVRNHEGGTASGNGIPVPKESPTRAFPEKGARGRAAPGARTPRSTRWRGDLWTTPGEETRLGGRVARTGTRRESRRQGQEGRANLLSTQASTPIEGPRGPERSALEGRGGQQ